MPSSRPSAAVYTAIILQTLISAGTFLVAKQTLLELQYLELAWLRFMLAALTFTGFMLLTRRKLVPPKGSRGRMLLLGFLAYPMNQVLFLWGLSLSTPAHAAIMYALTPAMVLVGARLFLHETINLVQAVGLIVAFGGALLVLAERGLDISQGLFVGDILLFLAVVAWSIYSVLARKETLKHGAVNTTAWSVLAGTLLYLPFAPLVLRAPSAYGTVSTDAWVGLAYLALLTSVLAYFLWSYALQRLEAARVAIFSNLQPILTALLAWLILGDSISTTTAVGGVLVLAGVAALQRAG